MSDNSSSASGGIGITGLLTVLFVALKLIPHGDGHMIDWSWWWVLAPLWMSVAVWVLVVACIALYVAVMER